MTQTRTFVTVVEGCNWSSETWGRPHTQYSSSTWRRTVS